MEIRSDIQIAIVGRGFVLEWCIGEVKYRRICADSAHLAKVMGGVISLLREKQQRTVQRDQHHIPEGTTLARGSDFLPPAHADEEPTS